MSSLPSSVPTHLAGKRALLYGRVSTVVQESDGYSLDSQRHQGRQIATAAQMRVVYEDFEQGSGQDWGLKGISNAIRMAKAGEIDVLVLKNVSRLSRQVGKQYWIESQLEQAGVETYYYDETYDPTPAGRLQRGVMAQVSQYQLEMARDLSMEGRYDKVELHGRPVGNGQTPYGWKRVRDTKGLKNRTIGYVHDPKEAAVIRRFRDLRHTPTQAFCDELNAEGIQSPGKWRPTAKRPRSGRWTVSSLWHVLNNPITWGEYRYGERQLVKGEDGRARVVPKPNAQVRTLQFPPILTHEEVDDIKAALASRRNSRGRLRGTDIDPFILRGLLICGHCGGHLATKSPGKDEPYRLYGCMRTIKSRAERDGKPQCVLPALIATRPPKRARTDGIEEIVWRAVQAGLLDEDRLREEIRRSREGDDSAATHAERLHFLRKLIGQKIRALTATTERWANAEDDLDRESFGATRDKLKREITGLQSEREQLEAYRPTGITDDEEAALLAFSAEARTNLELAEPADQLAFLRMLRIRGTVTHDPAGAYQIGKHRFTIAWTGLLDLSRFTGDDMGYFVNLRMESPVNGGPPVARLARFGEGLSDDPLEFKDGYVLLPTKPGLGMDMNEGALRANAYQHFPKRSIRMPGDEP